jgi:hypothetical protein
VGPEIVVAMALACLLLIGTVLLLDRFREDKRRKRLALDEARARAVMEDLCPQGWTANITLYGSRAPLPDDVPPVKELRVRLDWAELTDDGHGGRVAAVVRRLWAKTLPGALNGMVADRRLDRELEEIEHSAVAKGPVDRP